MRPGCVRDPGEPLDQRDAEREGLACSRPGLADDVLPVERDRQRELLDRKGGHDPGGIERCADLLRDPEVAEGLTHGGLGRQRLHRQRLDRERPVG